MKALAAHLHVLVIFTQEAFHRELSQPCLDVLVHWSSNQASSQWCSCLTKNDLHTPESPWQVRLGMCHRAKWLHWDRQRGEVHTWHSDAGQPSWLRWEFTETYSEISTMYSTYMHSSASMHMSGYLLYYCLIFECLHFTFFPVVTSWLRCELSQHGATW